jgi:DNA-binding beta-propeller fold protein YncE
MKKFFPLIFLAPLIFVSALFFFGCGSVTSGGSGGGGGDSLLGGKIYVMGNGSSEIVVLNPNTLTTESSFIFYHTNRFNGAGYNATYGKLYVSDNVSHEVLIIIASNESLSSPPQVVSFAPQYFAFSTDESVALVSCADLLWVFDPSDDNDSCGCRSYIDKGASGLGFGAAFNTANNKMYVTVGTDRILRFDINSFPPSSTPQDGTIEVDSASTMRDIVFPTGNSKFFVSAYGWVGVYDVASESLVNTLECSGYYLDKMAVSPNGKKLYIGTACAGRIDMIDLNNPVTMESHEISNVDHMNAVAVSSDSSKVFSYGWTFGTPSTSEVFKLDANLNIIRSVELPDLGNTGTIVYAP